MLPRYQPANSHRTPDAMRLFMGARMVGRQRGAAMPRKYRPR